MESRWMSTLLTAALAVALTTAAFLVLDPAARFRTPKPENIGSVGELEKWVGRGEKRRVSISNLGTSLQLAAERLENSGKEISVSTLMRIAEQLVPERGTDEATAFILDRLSGMPEDEKPIAFLWIARAYGSAYRVENAARAYEEISYRYPDSAEAPEALMDLALLKDETGETSAAAQTFKELALRYPAHPLADDAMARAITLMTEMEMKAEAAAARRLLNELFPTSPYRSDGSESEQEQRTPGTNGGKR